MVNRFRTLLLMKDIQRLIDYINAGLDFGGKAEQRLRRFCYEVLNERSKSDPSWLIVAEELIAERLEKGALEGDAVVKSTAIGILADIQKYRENKDALRDIFISFALKCNQYNICFLAAGFGDWQEQYRAKEEGNVVEAAQQILEFGT